MSYTILSAQYGNPDNTVALLQTVEAGAVSVSAIDTPAAWAEFMVWAATNTVAPYVPLPPILLTRQSDVWDRCADDAEASTLAAALASAGTRVERTVLASPILNHEHPAVMAFKLAAGGALGETRADELLAPSPDL